MLWRMRKIKRNGGTMVNPVITKKSGEYQTEESCLSIDGVRPCTRYEEIEVDYLNQNFKK